MFAKTFTLAIAAAATLLTAQIAVTAPARADSGDAVAAGAVGLVGGMILGGALADSQRDDRDVVVVHRRPARVIEEEEVVPAPRCWRERWYDRWGDLHVRRVCDR